MACRSVLFDGVNRILEKHFGMIPESVIYEGAVLVPSHLGSDCVELAKSVLSEETGLGEVFSTEDVSRRIQSIVIATVREGRSRTSELVERLCTRIEQIDEAKLVLVPLQGITLEEPITQIGPFCIRLMDAEAIGEATALWKAAIDRTTNTPEHKAATKTFTDERLTEELLGCVCLEVRICADNIRAERVAVQQAATLIDLLRYGSSGLHHKSQNLAIGFHGDSLLGICRRYILPLGRSDATMRSFRTGPFRAFNLNGEGLQVMHKLGVQEIAWASQRTPSQFETAILRAVHWFAEARIQPTLEYEIVTLAIALESALAVPGKRGHGKNALAEAVAVVLTDSPTERMHLFEATKAALWSRGDVVHQGASAAELDGIAPFRNAVQRFIATAIQLTVKFQTTQELLLWVDAQNSGLCKGK